MFSEDELGVARANGFGSHDLVSEGIGHHAVLVDARLVSESVGSDDGLVGRAAKGDTLGEHLAGGVELTQDDVVGVEELVTANHEAAATSSRVALPARSPMPLMVHSTWRAPPSMPARELATAMPRSLWQWAERIMSSIPGTRALIRRKIAAYSSGVVKPTVSGMLMVVAPA